MNHTRPEEAHARRAAEVEVDRRLVALPEAFERAREAGIGTLLTIGTRLDAFADVRAVAERYDLTNDLMTAGIQRSWRRSMLSMIVLMAKGGPEAARNGSENSSSR